MHFPWAMTEQHVSCADLVGPALRVAAYTMNMWPPIGGSTRAGMLNMPKRARSAGETSHDAIDAADA
jgi:hypothetical protein